MSLAASRYTAVAIVLHWAIAFAIVFNIVLGFWMHGAAEAGTASAAVFEAFQLHKSVGLTVLALSLVRLGWRLAHRPPPFPAHMPSWEKTVALATHWAFYALMIGLPLSGWLYVSAGWSHEANRAFNVPTIYFGLFQVPHLFGLAAQSADTRAAAAGAAFTAHWLLAYGAIALAALHVAAALKHQFFDRDATLARMVPGLKAPFATEAPARDQGRLITLGAGLGLSCVAAIALLLAVLTLGDSGVTPSPAPTSRAEAEVQSVESQPEEATPTQTDTSAPPVTATPSLWRVDPRASAIRFSGVHAGVAFTGAFSDWSADIRFDPSNLEASSANVAIRTASAADGVPLHDQSLPGAEWFDVANHPTATFRTERIVRDGDSYRADGVLTIKGRPINVRLPFTLAITGDRAIMDGQMRLRRRDADLGMESDPNAEWVSEDIVIAVHVEATRAP
ncbi:MAG: cytochrome b/b6 domain-containing protein [Hyphomonadaceae bacterium]|nr:cytochrome b/b6 domain-containing protein [Hyphomonadaceae bacterium]